MACEDLILSQSINDACSPVMGRYKEVGYIYDYNDIIRNETTIVDGKVTLSLTNGAVGVRVYDRSFNPFTGVTRESEENDRYVVFHDKAVIPLFVNSQINSKIVNIFGKKGIVLVLEHLRTGDNNDARYPVFGIRSGLMAQSSLYESSGIVANEVTLVDMNTGYPAYFLQPVTDGFLEKKLLALAGEEYLYLSGSSVKAGDTIAYGVLPNGSKIWVRYPDNTSQEFPSAFSQVWSGASGTIEVLVPKGVNTKLETTSSGTVGIVSSNVTGELRIAGGSVSKIYAPKASTLIASGRPSLRVVSCPNVQMLNLQGNAIPAQSFAKMILEMYEKGLQDGSVLADGGTNPTLAQITAASAAAGAAITDMTTIRGWTITLNA